MIRSFKDRGTEDVYNGHNTKAARRTLPMQLHGVARRKLDRLDAAGTLEGLRIPPSNHLESLKGNRKGQHSIRINDQYRICFHWTGTDLENVEITDYH